MFLPRRAGHSWVWLSQAPDVLHPLRQGCGAGWGPGTPASLGISSYFSASWQPLPFPACSRTLSLSDKAPLLLLPSPPTAHLSTGDAEQEQGCTKAEPPPLSSPSPKEELGPYITLFRSPWQWGKEQEPSLPHGTGHPWERAGQALPWEGFSLTGCGKSLPGAVQPGTTRLQWGKIPCLSFIRGATSPPRH